MKTLSLLILVLPIFACISKKEDTSSSTPTPSFYSPNPGTTPLSRTPSASGLEVENSILVVSPGNYGCVVKLGLVSCFGSENKYGQQNVPPDLRDVSQIAVGADHVCAITKGKVRCWGRNYDGMATVPEDVANALQVAIAGEMTCVLTAKGPRCWSFKNAFSHSKEVEKWLSSFDSIRELKGIDHADVGLYPIDVCVLLRSSVRCLNIKDLAVTTPVESQKEIKEYAFIHDRFACAVFDDGVECSGPRWNGNVPSGLKKPRNLAIVRSGACVVTDDGAKCWSTGVSDIDDQFSVTPPPSLPFEKIVSGRSPVSRFYGFSKGELICWAPSPKKASACGSYDLGKTSSYTLRSLETDMKGRLNGTWHSSTGPISKLQIELFEFNQKFHLMFSFFGLKDISPLHSGGYLNPQKVGPTKFKRFSNSETTIEATPQDKILIQSEGEIFGDWDRLSYRISENNDGTIELTFAVNGVAQKQTFRK